MNEQLKEQLSAFMDGELDDAILVSRLEKDAEARATWLRYHMIRDALHRDRVPGAEVLADRVAAALKTEPVVLAPRRRFTAKQIGRQVAGLAMAATIAAVAIIVMRETPTPLQDASQLAVGPITDKPVRMTADAERKLSGYIVTHNEFSASTQMKGMLPYTRIVSFTPAQSIDQRNSAHAEK